MSIVEWEVYAAPVPVVVYTHEAIAPAFGGNPTPTPPAGHSNLSTLTGGSSPRSRLPLLGDCLQQQDEHGYLFALVPVPSKDSDS